MSLKKTTSTRPILSARRALAAFITVCSTLLVSGCLGYPQGVEPVKSFYSQRYQGKWYEIARLDHSFERGLQEVSAEYSPREDGGLKVLNQGFNTKKGKWEAAEGRAYFVEDKETGYLKVSFFRPFYGSYVIFELDKENYNYAFVSGSSKDNLWLLSRTPQISAELKQRFESAAKEHGFPTEQLIWVSHGKEKAQP